MSSVGPATDRVVAVVPAKDRADTVAATVRALLGIEDVAQVVVVDDGSNDDTAEVAREAGARVLRLAENVGKGAAVAAAVHGVEQADVFLLVDADLGASASGASALLEPVLAGRADMTIAVLPPAGRRGGLGIIRRVAAEGIRRATSADGKAGFDAAAPLSGQRAVRAPLLRRLVFAPRFGLEVGLTIDAVRAGATVLEVPVAMDHRHTGRRLAGFSHRGRQGLDILRALWPRFTRLPTRLALVLALTVVAASLAWWSGARSEPSSVGLSTRADRVLIVGIPGLSLQDLDSGRLPNLDRLAARGALAAMTVRTLSPRPSVAEAYATLGAGARVRAADADSAATSAADGTVRVTDPGGIVRRSGSHVASRPGSLGTALHAAGLTTAVVGSADKAAHLAGATPTGDAVKRPTALALMDRAGRVDAGVVDGGALLVSRERAPFGLRADLGRVADATTSALAAHDVVLVDPGDLDRARDLVPLGAPSWFVARARNEALVAVDDLVGRLAPVVGGRTLMLVVGMTPPGNEWRLTPAVAVGAGVSAGYVHSTSTRRLGLVTLTDVAPTVLAALGAEAPPAMIGHPLRFHPGATDISRLVRLDRAAVFRERIYYPAALGFILFQAVLYSLVLAATGGAGARRPVLHAVRPLLGPAALAVTAFPLATFLLRLVLLTTDRWWWAGALVLMDLAIVGLAAGFARRRGPLGALALIMGSTVAVLLLDVATGARLQVSSIMGYSPHTAARFFGIGNTAFAVLAACAILAAALHVERAPRRNEALVAMAGFLGVVVLVDGAPVLGDDVGGVLTLVPVFGLTLLALAGRRITWKTVALLAAAALVAVASATAVDLTRPPRARTHLGQLASDTWNHGSESLFTTVARKAEVNLQVLRRSVWMWVVPVVALFGLVVLVVQRRAGELLPIGSPRRIGVLAAVAAGLLGAAVNDSGVVVTALALVYVGPLLAVLALSRPAGAPRWLEPSGAPTAVPSPS